MRISRICRERSDCVRSNRRNDSRYGDIVSVENCRNRDARNEQRNENMATPRFDAFDALLENALSNNRFTGDVATDSFSFANTGTTEAMIKTTAQRSTGTTVRGTERNFHDFALLTYVFESASATERDFLLESVLTKLRDIEARFCNGLKNRLGKHTYRYFCYSASVNTDRTKQELADQLRALNVRGITRRKVSDRLIVKLLHM